MRHSMHTEPTFTAPQFSPAHDALAMSALQSTREAIARWSGKAIPAADALPRDTTRVSPQARWYAQANNGFQDWLSRGGFAQACDAAPQQAQAVLEDETRARPLRNTDNENADACVD